VPVPTWLSSDPLEAKLPSRVRPGWAPRPNKRVKLIAGWEVPEGAGQAEDPGYAPTPDEGLGRIGSWATPQARQSLQALLSNPTPALGAPQDVPSTTSPLPLPGMPQPIEQPPPATTIQPAQQVFPSLAQPGPPLLESAAADTSAPADLTAASVAPTPSALKGPMPKQPGDLIDQARQAAIEAGIDPDIFARQIEQESGFNPNAKSPAGALGIAQFMPGTAKGLGVDPMDPQAALRAAAKLDKSYLDDYGGDWRLALAAYNAGPGNVAKYGGVPPFAETQHYVATVYGSGQSTGGGGGSVLAVAQSAVGSKYQYGGPGGRTSVGPQLAPTDCSGFVSWAYQQGPGIQLPAQTEGIWQATTAIDARQARPGDLVMYNMETSDPKLEHVGIYVGNGQMIHDSSLNPNGGVAVTDVWARPTFRRVPGATPEQVSGVQPELPPARQHDPVTSWGIVAHGGRQVLIGRYASGRSLVVDMGSTSKPTGTLISSSLPNQGRTAQGRTAQAPTDQAPTDQAQMDQTPPAVGGGQEASDDQVGSGNEDDQRGPTMRKRTANYQPKADSHNCGDCSMFRQGGHCTLVIGTIKPGGTCDYFERARTPMGAGQDDSLPADDSQIDWAATNAAALAAQRHGEQYAGYTDILATPGMGYKEPTTADVVNAQTRQNQAALAAQRRGEQQAGYTDILATPGMGYKEPTTADVQNVQAAQQYTADQANIQAEAAFLGSQQGLPPPPPHFQYRPEDANIPLTTDVARPRGPQPSDLPQVPGFGITPPDLTKPKDEAPLPADANVFQRLYRTWQETERNPVVKAVEEASQRPFPSITPAGFGIRDPRIDPEAWGREHQPEGRVLGPAGEELTRAEASAASLAGRTGRGMTVADVSNQALIARDFAEAAAARSGPIDVLTGLPSSVGRPVREFLASEEGALKIPGDGVYGIEASVEEERAAAKDFKGPIADRLKAAENQTASNQEMLDAQTTLEQADSKGGRAVGLPSQALTPEGLAQLRRRILSLAQDGESQRDWYDFSSQHIMSAAQNDKNKAERLAQLVAIYSSNTPVDTNMDNALKAWTQWQNGLPIKVATDDMNQRASKLLYDNVDWEGRKTNNFYRNLMFHIDKDVYDALGKEIGQSGVTVDIWMMRAFNYLAGHNVEGRKWLKSPSDRQYDFIQGEVEHLATQLGWKPEQVQAAIWSAVKSAAEGRPIESAGYHFGNALEKRLAQISWETRAGVTNPAVQDVTGGRLATASEQELNVWHGHLSEALLDEQTGEDILVREAGFFGGSSFEAPGMYKGQISPGTQTEVAVPAAAKSRQVIDPETGQVKQRIVTRPREDAQGNKVRGPDGKLIRDPVPITDKQGQQLVDPKTGELRWKTTEVRETIKENIGKVFAPARAGLNFIAAARGLLYKQDAVPWAREFGAEALRDANGMRVNLGNAEQLSRNEGRTITAQEQLQLKDELDKLIGPGNAAIVATRKGAWVLNISEGERAIKNPAFHDAVEKGLEAVQSSDSYRAAPIRSDGEYIFNDWKENPNGERHTSTIQQSGGRYAEAWGRLEAPLTERVRRAEELAAQKLGWTLPGRQPGAVSARFATTLGGAATGGLVGYQTADPRASPEERLGRAALFAAAGGMLAYAGASMLAPAKREAAIREGLPPEMRDTIEGQAITKQVSAASDTLPYLEHLQQSGQALDTLIERTTVGGRPAVRQLVPHTAADQERVLQRAALDLNDRSLLADSRAVRDAPKHEPLSPGQLRQAITDAVQRSDPALNDQQIAARVNQILDAAGVSATPARTLGMRQPAAMTSGMALRTAGGAVGAAAGGALAYQRTDPSDPHRLWEIGTAAAVGGMLGVGLPYLSGFLAKGTGRRGMEIANDIFAPTRNLDAAFQSRINSFAGAYAAGVQFGKFFEEGVHAIFGEQLDSSVAASIEEHNALPQEWANVPQAQAFLKQWQDIAEWAPKYVKLDKPINFRDPANPANVYWPHVVDEQWKNALRAHPNSDAARASGGYSNFSQNPFWSYRQPRSQQSMAVGMSKGIVYTNDQARALGAYVGKAYQEKAVNQFAKDVRALAKSGQSPDVWVEKVGAIKSGQDLGLYLPELRGVRGNEATEKVLQNMFGKLGPGNMLSQAAEHILGGASVAKHNMLGLSGFHGLNESWQFARALPGAYAQHGLFGSTSLGARTARFAAEQVISPVRFANEMRLAAGRVTTREQWARYLATDPADLLSAGEVLTPGHARGFVASNASGMLQAMKDRLVLGMNTTKDVGLKTKLAVALFGAVGGGVGGYEGGQARGLSPEQSALAGAVGFAAGAAAPLVPWRLSRVGPLAIPRPGGQVNLINNVNEMLFGRYIPYLKYRTYQLYKPAFGGSAAAEFSNQVYGGENVLAAARSRNVQNLGRFLMLAPDWQINWGKQAGQALFNWQGPLGDMNRVYWASTAISGAIMLELGNLAFGGHFSWDNAPGATLMVDQTKLYDMLGQKHVDANGDPYTPYLDILGPIRGMLEPLQEIARASVQGAMQLYNIQPPAEIAGDVQRGIPHPDPAGAVGRFGAGREGLLPRAAVELLTGIDYNGRSVEVAGDPAYLNIGRRVVHAMQGALPIGPSALAAGEVRGDPELVSLLAGATGMRTRRVSDYTQRNQLLQQWFTDNGMDPQTQQHLADERTYMNQHVTNEVTSLLADPNLTPQVPPLAGQSRWGGMMDQIIAAQQSRQTEYKQLLAQLNFRYGYDPSQPGGPQPPPGYEQQAQDLSYLFGGIVQGGSSAPADLDPTRDPNELYRMAWQPRAHSGVPQQLLADVGITAPDWLPKLGALEEKDARALSRAHLIQVQQVASQWNVDPAVMEDLVKAHLYGNGSLPSLPGMTSAGLDEVASQYHALAQMPGGPDRSAAQRKVIQDAAAAHQVDPDALRQRVIWRGLPMLEQPDALKAQSNATSLDVRVMPYRYANPDGTPWGTIDQERIADQLLAQASRDGRYEAGRGGFAGTYLNAAKDDVDPKLQALGEAKVRGNSARAAALQADTQSYAAYDRYYGRGKYLTNPQWQQFQDGTLPGAFKDIGSNYPQEFGWRMKILDRWATLTPEQRTQLDQPANIPLIEQDEYTGQLSRVTVTIADAHTYLTRTKSPGHLDLAHLGSDPSLPDGG
jgi:soluble lytic murein transglycosylase-like protein